MIGNLFLLVDTPFTKRDYIRFGIDIFVKNQITVIVWDVGLITNNISYSSYVENSNFKPENFLLFQTKSEIIKKIRLISKVDIVLLHFPISLQNRFIFKHLKINSIYFGHPPIGIVPELYSSDLSISYKLKAVFRRLTSNPIDLINKFIEKYFSFIIYRNLNPNFFIVTGSISNNYNIYNDIDLIHSHQLDYDIIIQNKNYISKNNISNYAVFLDEFVPFHPDNNNREIDCKAEDYYDDLNNFFDNVEKKLKLKVIISAHPRSNYDNNLNLFKKRRIIHGRTLDLVKGSKLVLTHASTANNFTVFFNKPLLFINSKKYSRYFQATIDRFSLELNKKSIDISSDYKLSSSDFIVNKDVYLEYIEKYIKTKNSPEINSWLIFINHLHLKFIN